MNSIQPTQKEIDNFLERTDFDLNVEVWESFMIEDDCTFDKFYELYQEKHLVKYGCTLKLGLE